MDASMKEVVTILGDPFTIFKAKNHFPKQYKGPVCDATSLSDDCEWDAVDQEMT